MKKIRLAAITAVFTIVGVAAPAAALTDSWDMVAEMDGLVEETGGVNSNRDMNLDGDYNALANSVNFSTGPNHDPAWGVVLNSADKDPGTDLVAMGVSFTATILNPDNYSGNLAQKGLFTDSGQIKIQLIPANGGTIQCRFEGSNGDELFSNTNVTGVADNELHWAMCVRNGNTLKAVVDGNEDFGPSSNVGSIITNRNMTVANKINGPMSDQHVGKNHCTAYSYGPGAIADVEAAVSGNC